jgi:shikimate kinase
MSLTHPDKIVLVGIMGAGKSTVGRSLAERIGYAFVDLDEEVERETGRSIPQIFSELGESAFRQLEVSVSERQDAARRTVLAAGGGWMARPGLRDRWPDAVRVWLRVSPEEAWARISEAADDRPMLDPARPRETLQRLLAEREAEYEQAEISVPTGGATVAETVDLILELIPFVGRPAPTDSAVPGS